MTQAWDSLFAHRLDEAQEQFHLSPQQEALRGLGWIAWLRDDWPALVESWGQLLRAYPHREASAAVLPLLQDACDDIPKDAWLHDLLGEVEERASPVLRRLSGDLRPHPRDDLRWTGWAPNGRGEDVPALRAFALQPAPEPRLVELAQLQARGYHYHDAWIWHAATDLKLEQATSAFLACDPLRAEVAVWINQQPVLRCRRREDERWLGLPFGVAVHLPAGSSTMQVRCLADDIKSPNCRFHWSDAQGRTLAMVSRRGTRRARGAPSWTWAEPWLPALFCEGVDAPLVRADLWCRCGESEKGQQELGQLQQSYPGSPLLARLLGRIRPRRRLPPRERATCGRIPVPAMEEAHPMNDWRRMEHARLTQLARSFPDHPWLLEDYLRLLDPWCSPLQPEALTPEEVDEACAVMEKLTTRYPNGWGWDHRRLGDLHMRRGRFQKAAAHYRRAARCAPRDAQVWCCLTEALLKLGQGPRAERALQAALRAEPARVGLRDRCAGSELDALVAPAPLAPPWPSTAPRRLTMRDVGFHDTCDAVTGGIRLKLELRQRAYPDGAVFGVLQEVREVEGEGLCSFQPPRLDLLAKTSLKTALLFHQGGAVEETSDLAQGNWVVYPDGRAGDLVAAIFHLERPAAATRGHFWQAWPASLAADHYALVTPATWPLSWSRAPSKTQTAGALTISRWIGKDPVYVSTFSSWAEVAGFFRRLYQRHWRHPHQDVKQQARALTRETAREEQGEVLYRFTRGLRPHCFRNWFRFQAPEQTLAEGGATELDKDLLLCALLAATGFDFELTLTLKEVNLPGPWFGRSHVLGPWAALQTGPLLCLLSGEIRL